MVVNAGGLWWRKDLPIFAVMHIVGENPEVQNP